ncbi:MAG: hypothetical protein COT43_08220 [Candidatus Marinimicrobia bacterium CG08_land_8_20_14_0_20_45_22]|nr:MAG: hypothetical protein COT43_08220 [Candidatus Marinimicrobia bacterium CG08_land_8_20_14_0_20_45_22]
MNRSVVPEERTNNLPILKSDSVTVCKKFLSFYMNDSWERGMLQAFPFFMNGFPKRNDFEQEHLQNQSGEKVYMIRVASNQYKELSHILKIQK